MVKTFPRELSRPGLRRRCGEADEGFQQIGRRGGALDVFAHARPHGADDQLRLGHGADSEHGRIGKFLVEQLDCPQRRSDAVGGDIDQNHVGGKALRSAG